MVDELHGLNYTFMVRSHPVVPSDSFSYICFFLCSDPKSQILSLRHLHLI